MNTFEKKRREFMLTVGGMGLSQVLVNGIVEGQAAARQAWVLGAGEGEHLIHFRDGSNIFIKSGTTTGSQDLAMGTQQVKAGTGIPVHRHFKMDEAFYVLEGSGRVLLNDVPYGFEKGSVISIPKGTWHGFENPEHELLFLWVVTPAGLDEFFRETCSPPGVAPKQFTREQIREIAKRYDTEFR